MGCRAKIWNKRNQSGIKRSYGSNVDLLEWKEEAVKQRDLNRFYREQKMRSLRERVRRFIIRHFLNRQKRKEVNKIC